LSEDERFLEPVKSEKVIHLEVYCDEITRVKDKDDESIWMYLGALFVPLSKKDTLLSKLLNLRCIKHNSWHWDENNCPNKMWIPQLEQYRNTFQGKFTDITANMKSQNAG